MTFYIITTTISLVIQFGFSCLLTWLIRKNAKLVSTILIGLLSLGASIPLLPIFIVMLPDSGQRSLAFQYAPELASLVFAFSFILIVCTLIYIALVPLCIASVIKICKAKPNVNLKYVKAIFLLSALVAAVTLITLIISLMVKFDFGIRMAEMLFNRRLEFILITFHSSSLILTLGIAGLILLKNELNVKPDEVTKTLSNRFFLSVVNIVLFYLLPIITIIPLFMQKVYTFSLLFCVFTGIIMNFLSGIAAILIGGGVFNPEKMQKFLKFAFSAIILLSTTILIIFIIHGVLSDAIYFLVAWVLGILGFFLVRKSQIIDKKIKIQKSNTQSIKMPVIKLPDVSSEDIAKGAETLKQNTTVFYNRMAASYQSAFSRAKQMLLNPQTEYQVIEQEYLPHTKVLISYVLPLLLIPALFAFIGYGLVGYSYYTQHFSNVGLGVRMAIVQMAVLLGGIYLSALIINILADNFGAMKNFGRTFSLVAYAYTPIFLAGIFHIHHSLWWLVFLAGFYGLYLLFVGFKPMMKPAEDKAGTYSIISLAVTIVGYIILFQILKAIMLPNFFFH